MKNLSYNEEFFQGHFPGHPIMPGVLIIEVLAKTAAIMGEPEEGSIYMKVGVEKFKFQQQVVPGDQIICTANLIKRKLNFFFIDGVIKIVPYLLVLPNSCFVCDKTKKSTNMKTPVHRILSSKNFHCRKDFSK